MRADRSAREACDPTFELLLACLRPAIARGRAETIVRAAAGGFDSERLVALAHRHRVAGFVAERLSTAGIVLPTPAGVRLAEKVRTARMQALRLAAEELRVGRALSEAGVDALFVKGATLAMRAHGTLGLKSSWDVDVLVSRDRMTAAGEVLTELGYRLSILGGTVTEPVQVRRFLAANKEAEWHDDLRGTVVELHTELSDHRTGIPTIGLGSPRQDVAFAPGETLETLATAPLFAYLAYHGTSHLWARLKWLADIAALLKGTDVEQTYREAVALGAGRTPGVAVVLSHELLGLKVQSALLTEILGDRVTRRLLRYARAAIVAPQTADGVLMTPFREMIAHARAQSWLVPGFAHRLDGIRRFFTRPRAAVHLRVPSLATPFAVTVAFPWRMLLRQSRIRRQVAGKTASRP